jgi:hypothetical protein
LDADGRERCEEVTNRPSASSRTIRPAVLPLAPEAPADPRWLPARDVLFEVVSELDPDSSWPVGQICTPNFLAFALDRIHEAWKVPSMSEVEL